MTRETWPNFFIVGAARAGTTSLYSYLSKVPGVYVSPVKEPHFFTSRVGPHSKHFLYLPEKERYLKLFSKADKEMAIGEASTSYLYDEKAASRIQELIPHAKIIIMLRDPITRAFSQYLMDIRYGMESHTSFYEAIIDDWNQSNKGWWFTHLYVELGQYFEQVQRYITAFGIKQLKIVIFEDFVRNTKLEVDSIIKFLGLEQEILEDAVKVSYNSFYSSRYSVPRHKYSWKLMEDIGKIRNKNLIIYNISKVVPVSVQERIADMLFTKNSPRPELTVEAKAFLHHIYDEDAKNLEKLLNRSIPWMN